MYLHKTNVTELYHRVYRKLMLLQTKYCTTCLSVQIMHTVQQMPDINTYCIDILLTTNPLLESMDWSFACLINIVVSIIKHRSNPCIFCEMDKFSNLAYHAINARLWNFDCIELKNIRMNNVLQISSKSSYFGRRVVSASDTNYNFVPSYLSG